MSKGRETGESKYICEFDREDSIVVGQSRNATGNGLDN